MAITCTPENLADVASCWNYLPWRTRQAIRIINWCAFLNGTTMTCTPEALANEARCFVASLSAGQLDAIETYLSCQIANAGGGGGDPQVFSGNYAGAAPPDVPTTSAAFAYDLDSPYDTWVWNGAAWQ